MTAATFQRARKPEQIVARREAILAAAAELFDEAGPEGAGLNAIAARAGFTKSNVYRYFESREAVLISLFLDDFESLAADFEARLVEVQPNDFAAVAHVAATAFTARPRLCRLLAILSNVLERNVSETGVIELKTAMFTIGNRISSALSAALPRLTPADCAWAASIVGALVSGLWPTAHPSPVVAGVVRRPEFQMLQISIERDLERALLVLLKGLAS